MSSQNPACSSSSSRHEARCDVGRATGRRGRRTWGHRAGSAWHFPRGRLAPSAYDDGGPAGKVPGRERPGASGEIRTPDPQPDGCGSSYETHDNVPAECVPPERADASCPSARVRRVLHDHRQPTFRGTSLPGLLVRMAPQWQDKRTTSRRHSRTSGTPSVSVVGALAATRTARARSRHSPIPATRPDESRGRGAAGRRPRRATRRAHPRRASPGRESRWAWPPRTRSD